MIQKKLWFDKANLDERYEELMNTLHSRDYNQILEDNTSYDIYRKNYFLRPNISLPFSFPAELLFKIIRIGLKGWKIIDRIFANIKTIKINERGRPVQNKQISVSKLKDVIIGTYTKNDIMSNKNNIQQIILKNNITFVNTKTKEVLIDGHKILTKDQLNKNCIYWLEYQSHFYGSHESRFISKVCVDNLCPVPDRVSHVSVLYFDSECGRWKEVDYYGYMKTQNVCNAQVDAQNYNISHFQGNIFAFEICIGNFTPKGIIYCLKFSEENRIRQICKNIYNARGKMQNMGKAMNTIRYYTTKEMLKRNPVRYFYRKFLNFLIPVFVKLPHAYRDVPGSNFCKEGILDFNIRPMIEVCMNKNYIKSCEESEEFKTEFFKKMLPAHENFVLYMRLFLLQYAKNGTSSFVRDYKVLKWD